MVTSFSVSADNSAQTCGNGCLFRGASMTTLHPNTGVSQSYSSAYGGSYAADIGSGLICGYAARTGSYIDAFGLVFMQKVTRGLLATDRDSGISELRTSFACFTTLFSVVGVCLC